MISFIVPIDKRRLHQLSGFTSNIERICKKYNEKYEIIVAKQKGNQPFMRGQLMNLGFKESKGDLIVCIDVDIRLPTNIDFYNIMSVCKNPYLPWDTVTQVKEEPDDTITLLNESRKAPRGFGACSVFTRDQFITCRGFSNLVFGWGREDELINVRCKFKKLKGTLFHVKHAKSRNEKYTKHNRNIFVKVRDKHQIDKNKDSFKHTIADIDTLRISERIKSYTFSNIRVPNNFKYLDLIPKELKNV